MERLIRFVMIMGIVAVLHFGIYFSLFSAAFGVGDAGHHVPSLLQIILGILGAPIMYLMWLPPQTFELGHGRWWGDDSNFVIAMSLCNSAVWGAAVAALVAWLTNRRKLHAQQT